MTKEEREALEARIIAQLEKMSREDLEKVNAFLDKLEKEYADAQK